jgi:2-amino-4-hydroxy-6-hydroxymethyldihydropteridine diphosphokinase
MAAESLERACRSRGSSPELARGSRRRGAGCEDRAQKSYGDKGPERAHPAQNSTMRAYVGLGANLGNRTDTVRRALALLDEQEGIEVVEVSTLRETDPVGYVDQPRFLNGAAELETELPPRALLERLLAVETALGRQRTGPRYGPRTIDLDLLVYGDEEVAEPGLSVPHPRLAERRFALEPLAELNPELYVPGRGRVLDLLAGLQSG